jgi:hypothetical protein
MMKWEYLSEAIGVDDLDARGQEGWELVTSVAGVMIYKRPMADNKAEPVAQPVPEPAPEPAAA